MGKIFLWPTIGFNYYDLFDLLQFSTNIIWIVHQKITLKLINKWGLLGSGYWKTIDITSYESIIKYNQQINLKNDGAW